MENFYEKRGEVYYEFGSNKPYSGSLETVWANGEPMVVTQLKNGKFHGECKIFWNNGQYHK